MCVAPHMSLPEPILCPGLTGGLPGDDPCTVQSRPGTRACALRVPARSISAPSRTPSTPHAPGVPNHMTDFEKTPPDVQELLGKRISQLGLRLEGSPVERFVHRLYRELERKGLRRFRPVCYLTDEWGCPDGQPVIGIPFYLADPKLARLEARDERSRGRARDHDVPAPRGGARVQLRVPAVRDARLAAGCSATYNRRYRDDYRPVPFSPEVRAAHRRLVRAEASRRGLRRDVRGLAHAAFELAEQIQTLASAAQAALC